MTTWPRSTWRLLNTGWQDGAVNMATDEAILIGTMDGTSPPTLRFYGWEPPCVSIGYAQSLRDEIDLEACLQSGYRWVRRPTGGRAVLHIDELTYSISASQAEPRVGGDIVTSYRRLSQGLLAGLRLLGCAVAQAHQQLEAAVAGDATSYTETKSAACFDVPSHYEITALGRKLVGSAQVRRRGAVLQHGALPLTGDVARLVDVLTLPKPRRLALRAKLCRRAVTLEEALGRSVTFDRVASALAEGFSQALNIHLVPGTLSAAEQTRAQQLAIKYAGDEWTYCR